MALTNSTMRLPLGSKAPAFTLPDPDGKQVSLDEFKSARALLVVFLCNHCPFVKHIGEGLAKLAKEYRAQGVAFVGINSNDTKAHPDDSPAKMKIEAAKYGYSFPYLFDETQEVAKAYRAACTPDFFLFDREQKLAYRGQMDDSRPGNGKPVTGVDLRSAMDATLAGQPVPEPHKPSAGCNIKWIPGNEPEYYK